MSPKDSQNDRVTITDHDVLATLDFYCAKLAQLFILEAEKEKRSTLKNSLKKTLKKLEQKLQK
uniref:Uncharacterized protein n=1 Tax=Glossina brevipalpis TaxID=37001 RepID=A0A1A9WHC3_9MUSC